MVELDITADYYILEQATDGSLALFRAASTSANYFQVGEAIPPDEYPPALKIGQEVMAIVKPKEKLLPPIIRCESSDGGQTMEPEYAICFPVVPIEPQPRGSAYLISEADALQLADDMSQWAVHHRAWTASKGNVLPAHA